MIELSRREPILPYHHPQSFTATPTTAPIQLPIQPFLTGEDIQEDLEQLSRNMETTLDLPKKEPMKVMLELLAKSVTTGAAMEPLCNGEEALITAKAIDDARKIAQWRFIRPQV